MTNNKRNTNNIFYIFLTAHLIFWTLVPSLTNQITKYLKSTLSSEELKRLKFLDKKIIRCKLRALPNEIQGGIATSVIFSAWNVATYVNQIDDYKVLDAEKSQKYQKIVSAVVNKNNGLYFNNEMFIISKT